MWVTYIGGKNKKKKKKQGENIVENQQDRHGCKDHKPKPHLWYGHAATLAKYLNNEELKYLDLRFENTNKC
jgi:hypothetical protein